MSVFAMFGATAYSDAPRFYTFSDAMYTMFLTLCLDGWADLVESTEEFYPPSSGTLPPKLFFIAYIFVIVFILMPVFVAAILDGYRTSAYLQSKADAKNRGRKAMEEHVCRDKTLCRWTCLSNAGAAFKGIQEARNK